MNSSYSGYLDSNQLMALSWIYFVTGCLSWIGSLSIIIATLRTGKAFLEDVLPIFQISVADFWASNALLVGVIGFHLISETVFDRWKCLIITMFSTAMYMCTFGFTVAYAWRVYRRISQKLTLFNTEDEAKSPYRRTAKPCFSTNALVSFLIWYLPHAVSILIIVSDSYYDANGDFILNDDICTCCFPLFHYESRYCQRISREDQGDWINWYSLYKHLFLCILLLSTISVTVLYFVTVKKYSQLVRRGGIFTQTQRSLFLSVKKQLRFFAAVFILVWFPSLILGTLSFSHNFSMKDYYFLFVIQACLCPLQGFLNSVIYGWSRERFRRRLRVVSDERTPAATCSQVEELTSSYEALHPSA